MSLSYDVEVICRFGSFSNIDVCYNKLLLEIPPDAGFAHPLGMQSGRIRASQLSGPSNADKMALTKARLFGKEGWKPDDAYLESLITKLVSGTLPTLLTAPIYCMVTFTRMKKISYFVIQDSQKTPRDYSQSFFLIYNETQWKHYGSTSAMVLFYTNILE